MQSMWATVLYQFPTPALSDAICTVLVFQSICNNAFFILIRPSKKVQEVSTKVSSVEINQLKLMVLMMV